MKAYMSVTTFCTSSLLRGEHIPIWTLFYYKHFVEELKKLTVDRVLNPWKYQVETVPRTGFAAADWSPLGADNAGR